METTFKAAQASFLDKLLNFVTIPDEGLMELADRFDENAIPLLSAGLITERHPDVGDETAHHCLPAKGHLQPYEEP